MGYTAAEAHVHADELGDTFTDDMIERIEREARPPGPLPARLAGRHRRSSRPRTASSRRSPTSRRATRATIVRLAEHDGELLHWFYDQGFVPGATVEVRDDAARGRAAHASALDGDEQTIGEKAAAGLFVRPARRR